MPLSRDEAKRRRQLANLSARPPAPPAGNRRALRHGGYAAVAAARLDMKTREVFDALAADAPLREAGELPAADAALVRLAAECLCRIEDLGAFLRDHGLLDGKGEVRGAVELESRLRREAADYFDALGMSPRSRVRLGLDLLQAGADLSTLMAADAEAERREREADGDA